MKKTFLLDSMTVLVVAVFFTALVFAIAAPNVSEAVGDSKEIEQIRKHQEEKDFNATIKKAEAYLKSHQNNTEVLVRLAECYADKGELLVAEEYVKKALKLTKDQDIFALRAAAMIYRRQSEESKDDLKKKYIDLAIAKITEALAISPKDAWVNAEAAQIYLHGNSNTKAAEAIGRALDKEPLNTYFLSIKQKIESM